MTDNATAHAANIENSNTGLGLLDTPLIDPAEAASFYHSKLSFETDPSDVWGALEAGETGIVVIDTRSTDIYAQGHVPDSINIPWREINESTTASIPKDKLVVTYCNGCNGATKGAAKITALGFRAKEMIGGFDWWKRYGFPVETGASTEVCSTSPVDESNSVDCGC